MPPSGSPPRPRRGPKAAPSMEGDEGLVSHISPDPEGASRGSYYSKKMFHVKHFLLLIKFLPRQGKAPSPFARRPLRVPRFLEILDLFFRKKPFLSRLTTLNRPPKPPRGTRRPGGRPRRPGTRKDLPSDLARDGPEMPRRQGEAGLGRSTARRRKKRRSPKLRKYCRRRA